MHLISKLKASVGVLLTRTVPGLFLKQSGAPLHGKKTAKLLKVTVKKQTIVTEYVCCKRTNKRPHSCETCSVFFHAQELCLSLQLSLCSSERV